MIWNWFRKTKSDVSQSETVSEPAANREANPAQPIQTASEPDTDSESSTPMLDIQTETPESTPVSMIEPSPETITAPVNEELKKQVIAALKTVYDPEIPVNIYDIGLIYDIDLSTPGRAGIEMTLTSPNCPEAEAIPVNVEKAIKKIEGIETVQVDIVWEPPWTPDQLSEAAKLELGML